MPSKFVAGGIDIATGQRSLWPLYGPSQKICNVGQVANLPKTRQIGNLPHVGMLHIYCDGPYSFDAPPLEFTSSVYQEFLNDDQYKLSAYYTPPHLVDFVLDGVLSWGGDEWDLRILDPCCGSGIFLVKAFQRLVQRWKNANPDVEPRVDDLRGFLERNLFGVDDSEDAIRVKPSNRLPPAGHFL